VQDEPEGFQMIDEMMRGTRTETKPFAVTLAIRNKSGTTLAIAKAPGNMSNIRNCSRSSVSSWHNGAQLGNRICNSPATSSMMSCKSASDSSREMRSNILRELFNLGSSIRPKGILPAESCVFTASNISM